MGGNGWKPWRQIFKNRRFKGMGNWFKNTSAPLPRLKMWKKFWRTIKVGSIFAAEQIFTTKLKQKYFKRYIEIKIDWNFINN